MNERDRISAEKWVVGGPYPAITVCRLTGEDDPEVDHVGMEPVCTLATASQGYYLHATQRTELEKLAHLIAAAALLYEALLEISDALEGAKAANPEASIEFFDDIEIEIGWRKRLKDALAAARGERKESAE